MSNEMLWRGSGDIVVSLGNCGNSENRIQESEGPNGRYGIEPEFERPLSGVRSFAGLSREEIRTLALNHFATAIFSQFCFLFSEFCFPTPPALFS
jgi:hypothetical protein